MKIKLTILFLTLSNLIYAQWEQASNGMWGGRIHSLAVSGSRYFAGTEGGGLFVSDNSGLLWNSVASEPRCQYVTNICVDTNRLYFMGNMGLYYSSDNGDNWSVIYPFTTPYTVQSLTVKGDTILMAKEINTIDISTDNGISWNSTTHPLLGNYFGAVAIIGNNVVVGSNNNGILTSTNLCASFTSTIAINGISRFYVHNNIIYGVCYGKVVVSSDYGLTWTTILPNGGGLPISCIVADESRIVIGTTGNGIFASFDQGATWSAKSQGLSNSYIESLAIQGDTIIAGTNGSGVYLAVDSLNQWQHRTDGIVNFSIYEIRKLGNSLFAGLFSKNMKKVRPIYRSDNNALNWQVKSNGIPQTDYFLVTQMCKVSTMMVAPFGQQSVVGCSSDNGENWSACNSGLPSNLISSGIINLSGNLYCGSNSGRLYESIDNAGSWTAQPQVTLNNIRALACYEDTALVVSTNGIAYTFNQGLSWVQFGITNPSGFTCIMLKGQKIFAGTQNNGVFVSTDWGETWSPVNTGFPALTNFRITSLASSNDLIFAGTSQGTFFSANYGQNWTDVTDNLINPSTNTLHIAFGYVYAGTDGSGIWRKPLGDFMGIAENSMKSYPQVYPNPCMNELTIDNNGLKDNFRYSILNAVGQIVMQGECAYEARTIINLDNFKDGIYFVKIFSSKTTKTVKLFKIKL